MVRFDSKGNARSTRAPDGYLIHTEDLLEAFRDAVPAKRICRGCSAELAPSCFDILMDRQAVIPTEASMPSPQFKYWAFISYSHRDKTWGDWLHRSLEAFKVPSRMVGRESRDGRIPARLFPVFRDREELPTSGNLSANIDEALAASRYLVLICSPHCAASRWVDQEIRTFKLLGREDRILCLIVDGEPNAADKPDCGLPECFPPALKWKIGRDGKPTQERAEPIAADARPGRDGKDDARLKVLAGLLGVGFDDLRQREKRRIFRNRVIGAAVAGGLLAIIGAVWKWQENKKLAEQAYSIALKGREALDAGDWASAAAYYARSNVLLPSRFARKNALYCVRQLPRPRALLAGEGPPASFAFSPDGSALLVGSLGGPARLWDLRKDQPIGEPLELKVGDARAVAFSPNGKIVFVGGSGGTVRQWDAASGEPRSGQMLHAGPVESIAVSLDGKTALTGSTGNPDGIAQLWDLQSGKPIGRAFGPWVTVYGGPRLRHDVNVTLSPDGKKALVGAGMEVDLWDILKGRPLGIEFRERDIIQCAAFSPDGKRILTATDKGRVRLWDAATGRSVGSPMLHGESLAAAGFSPDGRIVLSAGGMTVRLWDIGTGMPVGRPIRDETLLLVAAFSPDGQTVITGGFDRVSRLWDVRPQRLADAPYWEATDVSQASFDPQGRRVITFGAEGKAQITIGAVTYGDGGKAQIWQADTGRRVGDAIPLRTPAETWRFRPDGKTVMIAVSDGDFREYAVDSGRPVAPPKRYGERFMDGMFGAGSRTGMEISPDLRRVLIGSEGRAAQLFGAGDGRPIGEAMLHDQMVRGVQFSPDGGIAMTISKGINLWDGLNGKPLGHFRGAERCPPISPNGAILATRSPGGDLQTYVVRTGKPVGPAIPCDPDRVIFATGGTRIATVCPEGLRLWDFQQGQPIGKAMRPAKPVKVLGFGPDGETLIAGCEDGTVQLWDAASQEPLGTPMRHHAAIQTAAFSSDGKALLTLGEDRVARLWDVSWLTQQASPKMIDISAQLASFRRVGARREIEKLSIEEWRRLLKWSLATHAWAL